MNILESKQNGGSKVQAISAPSAPLASLWMALPLAALFLSGCPIYSGDAPRRVPCTSSLECSGALTCIAGTCQCVNDSDCPSGQSCVAGSCTVVTAMCTNDSQCPTGQHCQGGSCVPGTRVCLTHGDCDVGFMCDISSCEPSTTCGSDADCTMSGFWCDFRNTCVPHGANDCRSASDCTSGQLCIEGTCTGLPATCQFSYDCPAGTACVNAECTAVCRSDADCVAGDTCNPSHFCEATTDCETSATCTNGEHCVDGRCLADCHGSATCPTSGRETSYCANDSFCHPSWQPAVACNIDSDCASGRHCLAHVCRTPCPDGATGTAAGNAQCLTIDSTLPYCLLDSASGEYLCNAQMSATASCRTSGDCTGTQECVNAACQ